jgi:hypothetical protein
VYVSRFLYVIREAWVLGSSGFVAWYGIGGVGVVQVAASCGGCGVAHASDVAHAKRP